MAFFIPFSVQAFDPYNCYSVLSELLKVAPPSMEYLVQHAQMRVPEINDVSVSMYEKDCVPDDGFASCPHVAIVVYVFDDGSFWQYECNYHDGECGIRQIPSGYSALLGFVTLI